LWKRTPAWSVNSMSSAEMCHYEVASAGYTALSSSMLINASLIIETTVKLSGSNVQNVLKPVDRPKHGDLDALSHVSSDALTRARVEHEPR
jgi:hypothetical protein